MSDQTPENLQFFLTAPTPCPYLEGREERKLFTHLSGKRAPVLHNFWGRHGFRRSQNLLYRPACEGCSACQATRVLVDQFMPNARQKRVIARNKDVTGQVTPPIATDEHYQLFKTYLAARHEGGGMTSMSYLDYEFMVEDTSVDTILITYRLGNEADAPLAAVALTDVMDDGLSMVYSFFDPALSRRSLGNFMILDHIAHARRLGLPYVYLGYWVPGSPKMAYKAEYQPMDIQTGPTGWRRFDAKLGI